MFHAYILQSEKTGTFYYGSTKGVEERIRQHNSGKVRSTKGRRPWRVIYTETFQTKSEAYKRELFFKSIEGCRFLKESGITNKKGQSGFAEGIPSGIAPVLPQRDAFGKNRRSARIRGFSHGMPLAESLLLCIQ